MARGQLVARALGSPFVDYAALLQSLRHLRAELDEVMAQLDEANRLAPNFPHRERYLKHLHALGRRIVTAHREWLDEVERDLDSGMPPSSTSAAQPRDTPVETEHRFS